MELPTNLKSLTFLCRVCLTSTKNLINLNSTVNQKLSDCKETCSIQNLLEIVTFNKVIIDDQKFPSKICQMCLSLLKISYNFQTQFTKSQKLLKKVTKQPPVEKLTSAEKESPNQEEKSAPVELIYCGTKFDLNDVLVVEEEETEKPTFRAFLDNLGKEISARFVDVNYDYKSKYKKIDNQLVVQRLNPPKPPPEVVIEEVADIHPDEVLTTLYECDTCKALFETQGALQEHLKAYRPAARYVCDKCGHIAQSKSALYHHLQGHRGRRHPCPVCPKRFVTASRLKVHLSAHRNERPYLCNVCGKGFNYPNALGYHMRLHTGEKRYVCGFCGLRYRMPNTLQRHLRTHTNDRPYGCAFCDKRFFSGGERAAHQMLHTGERPYKCEYCGKGFIKTSNLRYHYLSHPGPHHCHVCAKSFVEVRFLKVHLQRSHKMEEVDEV